jgi:hypothetical protein
MTLQRVKKDNGIFTVLKNVQMKVICLKEIFYLLFGIFF